MLQVLTPAPKQTVNGVLEYAQATTKFSHRAKQKNLKRKEKVWFILLRRIPVVLAVLVTVLCVRVSALWCQLASVLELVPSD